MSGGDNAQWSEEDQGEWRRQRTVEEGAVAVHGREGKVALVVDLAHLASTSSSPAAVEEGWQRHTVAATAAFRGGWQRHRLPHPSVSFAPAIALVSILLA